MHLSKLSVWFYQIESAANCGIVIQGSMCWALINSRMLQQPVSSVKTSVEWKRIIRISSNFNRSKIREKMLICFVIAPCVSAIPIIRPPSLLCWFGNSSVIVSSIFAAYKAVRLMKVLFSHFFLKFVGCRLCTGALCCPKLTVNTLLSTSVVTDDKTRARHQANETNSISKMKSVDYWKQYQAKHSCSISTAETLKYRRNKRQR